MSADPLDELMPRAPDGGPLVGFADRQAHRGPGEQWPSGAARGIQKVAYTHDAMIDLIISNPSISQNALAAHFGYTASWISQIISSDAFQARLAERRDEIVDPAIRATVEEQFKGIVFRSLDILRTKLALPAEQVPNNLVLRSLELSTRALGYGAKEAGGTTTIQETHVHLDALGERLVGLLQSKRQAVTVEGEIVGDGT